MSTIQPIEKCTFNLREDTYPDVGLWIGTWLKCCKKFRTFNSTVIIFVILDKNFLKFNRY